MDARETMEIAQRVHRLREQEINLFVNLAKVVAIQRIQQHAQEVRG